MIDQEAIAVWEVVKLLDTVVLHTGDGKPTSVFKALLLAITALRERETDKALIYQYEGGEDDGHGDKASPITWKEAYEEQVSYEDWAKKAMKEACEKIKADPNWTYGKNVYPSSYERAIVAGCGQAVKELQAKVQRLRGALEGILWQLTDGGTNADAEKICRDALEALKETE